MHPLQDFQVPSLEVRPLVILSLANVRQIGGRPYIRTRFVHGLSVFGKFGNAASAAFSKNLKFYFIKIEYSLYVLDRFNVLILKIIFKK